MKVHDRNLTGASAAQTGPTRETSKTDRGTAGSASTPGASGDRVELSSSLGRLVQTLSTFQSNRASRVQALATEYQSGGYHADSLATSQGIVSETLAAGIQ
jgi:anti-sigma28 factor (negative regulator of flagellin synthesis)